MSVSTRGGETLRAAATQSARVELTAETVEALAGEYERREPLYAVEYEQLETLSGALAVGEYGWRDVEWIVQWYYRRFLGAYPDAERREREGRFADNEFETVRSVLGATLEADGTDARLEALTGLAGVDVPVASAFLAFLEPDDYAVVGPRTWGALRAAGELDAPYPSPPSLEEYAAYLERYRSVADRVDADLWTRYRALWRYAAE